MNNAKNFLLVAGLLAVPATGSAQEPTHFSIGIGLAARTHPVYWSGFGVGLAHQPRSEGAFPGLGAFAHGSSPALGQGYHDDDYGHGHHDGRSPYDCWDYLWYDPWFGCNRYVLVGYPGFGWGNPHPAWWWQFGFLGWPSPRYVRYHWYAYGPFGYGGLDWWYPRPHGYVYHGYDGGGYLTPRGYRSGGHAKPRGHSGDRIVRGSPLFGPRYKEDPRTYVTDNGPERPVSRAVPRGSRADVGDVDGRRRPRETSNTRRARPRGETKPATTRSAPPKLRTRTAAPPRARAKPRAPTPKARPGTPSRPTPTARKTPTRPGSPTTRPTTPKRPTSTARTTPTRRATPKAKPTTPKRSSPKARPAPAKRPPPKASAPKRPTPKARPAPRRSGTSKPPPRRGGKD